MVNKLLIGVGLVALVAVGSIGVWKLADDDGRRIGALGPIEEPIALSWRGEWTGEAKYEVGHVVSFNGSSYVAEDGNAEVVPGAKEGPWALMAAQGAQGPAGTFNGKFQSPDGKWRLSVTDAGIEASGPNGQLLLDSNGVLMKTGTTLVLEASGTLDLKASAAASLRGATTRLGCASGGVPVARLGSQVVTSGLPAGANEPGQVTTGSQTVLTC